MTLKEEYVEDQKSSERTRKAIPVTSDAFFRRNADVLKGEGIKQHKNDDDAQELIYSTLQDINVDSEDGKANPAQKADKQKALKEPALKSGVSYKGADIGTTFGIKKGIAPQSLEMKPVAGKEPRRSTTPLQSPQKKASHVDVDRGENGATLFGLASDLDDDLKAARVSRMELEEEEVDPNDIKPVVGRLKAVGELGISTITIAAGDEEEIRDSVPPTLQDMPEAIKYDDPQDLKIEDQYATRQFATMKVEEEKVTMTTTADAEQMDMSMVNEASVVDSTMADDIAGGSDTEDPNDMPQASVPSEPFNTPNETGSTDFSLDEGEMVSRIQEEQTAEEGLPHHLTQDPEPEVIVIKDDPYELETTALRSLENGKKPRRMIVEVVVDTYENYLKRKKEDFEKIKNMKNSKIHGEKAERMDISLQSAWDRLKPIGLDPYPINLEEEIKDTLVSRAFMSDVYGGNSQSTFPRIGKKHLAKHGLNDFMYLNTQYQQMAPQFPGNPGLFINPEGGIEWNGIYRVFLRHASGKWQFIGFYTMKPSTPLSRQEWLDLDSQVKRTWCEKICTKGWGDYIRARIVARSVYHRRPTEDEWLPFAEARFKEAGPDDVRKALDKGHENLAVYTLKCIGYDEDFQRQICAQWANWVAPPPRPRKKRGESGQESGKTAKAKGKSKSETKEKVGKKRKRAQSVESELSAPPEVESEDEELSDDDGNLKRPKKKQRVTFEDSGNDDGALQKVAYRPKGTKSRPVVF